MGGAPVKPVLLLTGKPGSGKTSLIKEVVAGLGKRAGGFYTEEIRAGGVRQGFRLVTLDGKSVTLASVDIQSPYRVGKYGVDVAVFEEVGVAALRDVPDSRLAVVDEIGKMELFSAGFRQLIPSMIDGGRKMLGTIMLTSNPWADAVKNRPQVRIIEVERGKYREVKDQLKEWLQQVGVEE